MFRDNVQYIPPFTDRIEEKLLNHSLSITDKTLVMTFYILFRKRCPDLKYNIKVRSCLHEDLSMFRRDAEDDSINFFLVQAEFDPETDFTETKDKFTKLEKFLTEKLNQKIYIRTLDDLTAMVFCSNLNTQTVHAVQVFIPQYYPKLFKENERTDDETALLVGLSQVNDAAYCRAVQTFLEREDVRRDLMHMEVSGFERLIRRRRYDETKRELEHIVDSMDDYLRRYSELNQKRVQYQLMVDGARNAVNAVEENSELEQYLSSNKNLTNISVTSDSISFIVKTFVNPYLPDDWDNLSRNGSIFRGRQNVGNCLDDPENLKLLLDAIFSRNHTLKLKMCAFFKLDYYGNEVRSCTGYNYVERNPALKDYIPNTHLNRFNCFGQNMADILTQIRENDTIGAIECCINVAKRINVSEGPTFGPFIESLKLCRGKCIVAPDGTEMTATEAVNYLKGQTSNETSSD